MSTDRCAVHFLEFRSLSNAKGSVSAVIIVCGNVGKNTLFKINPTKYRVIGGGGEIRTHETLARLPVFKTDKLDFPNFSVT